MHQAGARATQRLRECHRGGKGRVEGELFGGCLLSGWGGGENSDRLGGEGGAWVVRMEGRGGGGAMLMSAATARYTSPPA